MAEEPPEKKQKTTDEEVEATPAEEEKTEKTEEEAAESKEPDPPKELEEDAKKDSSAKIKDKVTFLTPDTTMNVAPSTTGNVLVTLTENGLQNLSACARANVGIKSGRYMFEVKILDHINPPDFQGKKSVRHFRIGFSAEGSLFLGEEENSICFDFDGHLVFNKTKKKCSMTYGEDSILAVVLNLDSSSPNFNTVSLFKDGARASAPQPLPDALKDQALFPAVTFKSCTVHVNFGAPACPLPFICTGVEEATTKDASVTKYDAPADGKYTVLFPVCMPDEGTFDWLDSFLEKNPNYIEFSDRAFMEWALKSGITSRQAKKSNDKPDPGFDVLAARRTLLQVLAMQPRNLVYMEVKGNLMKEERSFAVASFQAPCFKTVADVLVGEAPSSFKKIVQAKTSQAKQVVADAAAKSRFFEKKREWAVRQAEREKEKVKKQRQKAIAEARKKIEIENNKKAKEAAAKKAAEEGQPAIEDTEKTEEEEKKEEEVEAEEPDEPEPVEEDPPKVELTAEERAVRFFKHPMPDVHSYSLSTSMSKFTLPDASEGFTTVKYSWSKEKEAKDYMKNWLLEKKLTTRVEDITPSQWFKDQNSKWIKDLTDWKKSLNDYKAAACKRAADKVAREQRKKLAEKKAQVEAERKAKAEAEKAKAEADAKAKAEADAKAKAEAEAEKKEDDKGEEKKEETEKKEGEEEEKKEEGKKEEEKKEEEKKEEEKKEEEKKEEEKAEEEEEEPEEHPSEAVDFDGIDIFGVENVRDVGGEMPLLKEFQYEDLALLSLRAELHLLAHAFVKDVDDADRTGVYVDHVTFYYEKYFGKQLNIFSFGVKTPEQLVGLVGDTIHVEKSKVLRSVVPADLESYAVFVKLTEYARRHRLLMLDYGDESVKLNIVQLRDEKNGSDWKRDYQGWGQTSGKGQAFGKGTYFESSTPVGGGKLGKDAREGKGEKRSWNQDGKDSSKGDDGKGFARNAWGDGGKGGKAKRGKWQYAGGQWPSEP